MKVMMVGGINEKKASKLSKLIKDNCGPNTEVINVSIFTQKPLEEEEKYNPDVIVMLNKQSFEFKTSIIINGLGLIYPQMGQKKVLDELKKCSK